MPLVPSPISKDFKPLSILAGNESEKVIEVFESQTTTPKDLHDLRILVLVISILLLLWEWIMIAILPVGTIGERQTALEYVYV